MPFDPQEVDKAQQQQLTAARDMNSRVRLIAGPGTGKSRCILERVRLLLSQGTAPSNIFVVSFTRASAGDLEQRIRRYCGNVGLNQEVLGVSVSTMHSLALRTLRSANLLGGFAAEPVILDRWEQENLFDAEFTQAFKIPPARAPEVRRAYDAYWQTLQPLARYGTPPVSSAEQQSFTTFNLTTKQVYSCVLPGQVVRLCVDQMRVGVIDPAALPGIKHLIVDEYQDLNECDQEFIQRIADAGSNLFVAGDDDQSVYAFRHAAPTGIQDFTTKYPTASSHQIEYCFRCTPEVLGRASSLISANPGRLPKNLQSLYATAQPPVQGACYAWRYQTGAEEAQAIAQSCRDLVTSGIAPSDIMILVNNTRAQVPVLVDEIALLGLAFERPRGGWILDSDMFRLVLSILRILNNPQDYVAHRSILGLQRGVGPGTCSKVASKVVSANLNFKDIFYLPYPVGVFTSGEDRAINGASAIIQQVSSWQITDTLQTRGPEFEVIIATVFNASASKSGLEAVGEWRTLERLLPQEMTLEEFLSYLWSDTEAGQLRVLEAVAARLRSSALSQDTRTGNQNLTDRIRILTMHGAKGLDGSVVFIPGLEQGIMPHRRSFQAPGLMAEQRRLLYASVTRAKAACVLSLATNRAGAQAKALSGRWSVRQTPSQFLTDIGVPVQLRTSGMSPQEIARIVTDSTNL